MKSIAAINFKGGVGKTTVTWLLARYLAEKLNHKILVIDIDPQMSLTLAVNLEEEKGTLLKEFKLWYNQHKNERKTFLDFANQYSKNNGHLPEFPISHSLIYKINDHLHFIPSTIDMYWHEYDLKCKDKLDGFIRSFLDRLVHSVKFNYDYVFFDCPPSFTTLSYSVLSCADYLLLPVNPDVFAGIGLDQMIDGLLQRIQPWPSNKIFCLMNKARTLREDHLTSESKRFLEEVRRVRCEIIKKGVNIEVLDSFILDRVDIKNAIHSEKFPAEYEEYFNKIWKGIKESS